MKKYHPEAKNYGRNQIRMEIKSPRKETSHLEEIRVSSRPRGGWKEEKVSRLNIRTSLVDF